ncbi:MAG: L,D-transpeptidase [Chloroflexota bacterium]|nr:L,D-transpeptidase [Chloroflexota bacterium]
MMLRHLALLFALSIAALAVVACGTGAGARGGVAIESIGAPAGDAVATPTVPAGPPTPAPAADPAQEALRPTSGRWIEVDLTHYIVRLMDGATVVKTIAPVAVGIQVDTGAYDSTQTGIFHVYNKITPLAYDPPYKTYISDWVGFDPKLANGFHSFLKDKAGNVVDPSTGRVSNGCIRTPDAPAITAFATIGMPVWVHT